MKTLAVSWVCHGIRANAVAAGLIATRQTGGITDNPDALPHLLQGVPLQRLGRPDDIAAAVLFLTSPASSWTTGQTLPVDGGFSVAS